MTNVFSKNRGLVFGMMMVLLSGIFLSAVAAEAGAADRRGGPREFRDTRYQLNRSYPLRGQIYRAVPPHSYRVVHGGTRYYYHGGVWYRPYRSYYTVVLPPVGLFVPVLPPYYATIWVGGVPYYYANEVYYTHHGSGYVVVAPPEDDVRQAPPPADELFIYPRLGQSEKQQADDRYACHRWAVEQTGYDPTQPPETQKRGTRADYQRAMSACLDGRGYTVK